MRKLNKIFSGIILPLDKYRPFTTVRKEGSHIHLISAGKVDAQAIQLPVFQAIKVPVTLTTGRPEHSPGFLF